VQTPLPIDEHVSEIVEHVRRARTAVVVAPPGAGKTTRVPPALTALGRTILLQPRRVAARALARRIAHERGWRIGNEVGWQIRFERRFSERTQLLVATEGILTARLQSDPLLSDFAVVVLDEFHERSIHADLALALTRQAMLARDDLAVVVMSATIAAEEVAAFLGGARVFDIDARGYPIDIAYRTNATLRDVVHDELRTTNGDLLVFLPGAREIERARADIGEVAADVLPLHGSLDVDAQERALAPSPRRRIILATNIAETSLTVEGVTTVIDTGLHKVLRFDPETAVDHLVTERIAVDSATQRAGRAGRTRPGRAVRLWDERDILRPHREPEIRRVDLAPPVLDILGWGGDPKTFAWYERPPEERIDAAVELLRALCVIPSREDGEGSPSHMRGGSLATLGMTRQLPLHPRYARIVVDAHGADEAIEICAPDDRQELVPIVRRILGPEYRKHVDDATLRRALLAGYPDRVAQRREPKSPRLLLSSGTGATLARDADDGRGEFLVILDITGDLVRSARPVEREWLTPTHRETVQDGERIVERSMYGAIVLHEQTVGRVAAPKPARKVLPGPATLALPSGRTAKLDYRDDGSIVASVKLQELFGLADTPRINGTPVTFELLSPAGRPVQVTRDLRSFWNGAYQEVRKELRARYPRHPWPDDPWTAQPTHRTKKR
jgi:ATP-dependent helicase HrpB